MHRFRPVRIARKRFGRRQNSSHCGRKPFVTVRRDSDRLIVTNPGIDADESVGEMRPGRRALVRTFPDAEHRNDVKIARESNDNEQ